MSEIVVNNLKTPIAWERLSDAQRALIEELIITMTKEPNCSPYRAINTALDFMWPSRKQRDVNLYDILKALSIYNERKS